MIALQTIKYLIWDYCLTKLFNGFDRNFNILAHNNVLTNPNGTIDPKNLYVGMHISEIRAWTKERYEQGYGYRKHHYTWLNCTIKNLLIYNSQDINSPIHIIWSFSTYLQDDKLTSIIEPRSDAWSYNPLENGGSYDEYIEFYK